jgi:hypothetical protein
MAKATQKKQVFSISQKYLEVIEILGDIENKSEFICQAILEKANGTNKVDDDVVLEEKVKKILSNMVKDDLFLVSGNPQNISCITLIQQNAQPVVGEEVEENNGIVSEDDSAYLKDIFANM